MPYQLFNSDDARTHWRDILDAANAGVDVVIARYGKPMAAVISMSDYEAIIEELDDWRAGRRAQAALEAWQAEPSRGRAYSTVRDELIASGQLDNG